MPALPPRPSLDHLRRLAKDLVREAKGGETSALERFAAVRAPIKLAGAQLVIAREYGFPSWAQLKRNVERREILDARDVDAPGSMLADEPDLASSTMEHWGDHPKGASPLGYVAMLRYDTATGRWRDLDRTGKIARALIAAGAPVEGELGVPETPLITAASYGDPEVARVLIDAGADVEARAADDAGGVPGGTALLHAAVFGMTSVVDVLIASGAQVHSIEEAAAAGDISGWLDDETPPDARVRALVMAAHHQRSVVIDQLVDAGGAGRRDRPSVRRTSAPDRGERRAPGERAASARSRRRSGTARPGAWADAARALSKESRARQ
jgi:uncharacterized protein